MLENDDAPDGRPQRGAKTPDGIACQWLKVWLARHTENEKGEEKLMSEYNPNHPIQSTAMPDVGAGVIQRYFASAMQTPALVLGQLSKLSNYHLDKIDNRYVSQMLRDKLAETWKQVGDTVPAVLNLEQQSYFTLGYYQMSALLNREKAERIAEWKQKNENKGQNTEEEK